MRTGTEPFREAFFVEAEERLGEMEAALLEWERSPGGTEPLQAIFRAAHSIKGSGATFGLDAIARFAHALETLLDRMRSGTLDAASERIDLLLAACDVLQKLVEATRRGAASPPGVESVLRQINGILGSPHEESGIAAGGRIGNGQSAPRQWSVAFRPGSEFLRQGQNPLLLIRELGRLGELSEIAADISALPSLDQMDPENCYLAWSLHLRTNQRAESISEVFEFLDESSSVTVVEASSGATTEAQSRPQLDDSTAHGGRIKYLIIDDDPDCCLLVGDILSEIGRGHCVYNGAEAMVALRLALEDGEPYQLVCLDIMMPQKDGHETLKAIRALEAEHGIAGARRCQVIMTTSLRDSKHCLRSFSEGCENYVVKPVDAEELLAKVRELGLLGR